jgi:glycosyltransferase involved in cell wall biosynthesis
VRIAQVSPLYECVPPKLYGGTERIVSYLTEELVQQGHDVTLFASGDSVTAAKLVSCCERALRLHPEDGDAVAWHMLMVDDVLERAEEFDLIHFHLEYLHVPLCQGRCVRNLTTMHGRLDLPYIRPMVDRYREWPVVSISDSQRRPVQHADWLATIYHGIPADLLRFNPEPLEYLVFVGRIAPEKRVDRAIEIAKRTGMRLIVAAKVSTADQEYFERKIQPLLDHPLIEFVGEVGDDGKQELLGKARALLFPIDWPEPFGLAMIESMACGTPVIAFRCGSVPEVVDCGMTGYIANDLDEAVRCVEQLDQIDRRVCREQFEKRFTAERMARDYLAVYENLQSGKGQRSGWQTNPG